MFHVVCALRTLDISVINRLLMIFVDDLMPFFLHFECYLVYEKGNKVGHCHQLRLLLVDLLLSIAGSKPQDDVKPLLSQFLQAYHQLLYAKKET